MNTYEIEIKSLLGSSENADKLIESMKAGDPAFKSLGKHKQLNHYFIGGNTILLDRNIVDRLPEKKRENFRKIIKSAKDFSVRTRQADNNILIVIKATVDDTTSSNGTARIEFESQVDLSLEQLDQILLESGFKYQAKWSRDREEFQFKSLNVTVDKNAGYGYLAEFEKVIQDPALVDETKTFIRDSMKVLGLEELAQDRLERMFAFYNNNWHDYYGTEKVFNID